MKNYSAKSAEWLQRRAQEITAEMDGIRAQLDSAAAQAGENGGYTTAQNEWRVRAKIALRARGREHQALERELSRRKWNRIDGERQSFEKRFVDAARRRLDRDLYLDLCAEANAEVDKAAA